MIDQFKEAFHLEQARSGKMPLVAVVGHDAHDELIAELRIYFNAVPLVDTESLRKLEFMGIMVFRSESYANGIFLGGT